MTRRWWWALAAAAVLAGAAGAVLGISLRGRLYDVSTGPVLVSADGRVITPADRSAAWPPAMPFAYPYLDVPPGAICTQMFRSDDTSGWLAITQLAGAAADSRLRTAWPGTALRWRAVQVRGHRGWLATDSLTWYEAGQSILIVAAGRPVAAGAELLAVARSLR